MVDALCREASLRKNELQSDIIETIYFGGGTPSVLSENQLNQLLNCLKDNFQIIESPEVTFEANPENLTKAYLSSLKSAGINRLSIGLQSFDDEVLTTMNRAHNAKDSLNCVQLAVEMGFKSISIDLIYGIPNRDLAYWKTQVECALKLGANHISAYCLTIEENTVFAHLENKGDLKVPEDDESLQQFQYLVNELATHAFEQYEISNFALPGGISKHNSAYWLGKKYVGLGPSAHSFNGSERSWNIRNNPQYIKKINAHELPSEKEALSSEDRFNDYVLTRLRTKWGLEMSVLENMMKSLEHPTFEQELNTHVSNNNLKRNEGHIFLTDKGKFIADRIASDLFV